MLIGRPLPARTNGSPFHRVLLAVDPSDFALAPLEWAVMLCAGRDAEVHVLNVPEVHIVRGPHSAGMRGDLATRRIGPPTVGRVGSEVMFLRENKVHAEPIVASETLVDAIRRWSPIVGADLVILSGAFAHRQGPRALQHTIHATTASVLVVRSRPPPSAVLLADDQTDASNGARRVALRLANAWGARLFARHVVAEPTSDYVPDELDPLGIEEPERSSTSAMAKEELLEQAGTLHAGLVVAGRHHRTLISRMIHGSVSEHLAIHATTNVLIADANVLAHAHIPAAVVAREPVGQGS